MAFYGLSFCQVRNSQKADFLQNPAIQYHLSDGTAMGKISGFQYLSIIDVSHNHEHALLCVFPAFSGYCELLALDIRPHLSLVYQLKTIAALESWFAASS
jgi:hypothetical protein